MNAKTKLLALVTPGEMLVEEFLEPLDLSEYRLAKDMGVPPRRINELVHGKRAITTTPRSARRSSCLPLMIQLLSQHDYP